ncbi:MAG TPA: MarR family transcriptional regulator [Ktedonosporobacter sp.]|nr:MarR family transcriptional regulator [Ktedonosporobacter sp.]
MGTPDQQAPYPRRKSLEELETLSLSELFPYWSHVLWQVGMVPMLQHLLQINLTMSESQVVRQLDQRPLTIADVAASLAISQSAASRAVDRLVRDGYVSRTENPVDRRQKQLRLTTSGTALVEDLNHGFTSQLARLVTRLSVEEQEQFRRLVAHMVAAYPDETADAPLASAGEARHGKRAHTLRQRRYL